MSKEYYKKRIIDLRASIAKEREAKKKDNEYYANMIKRASTPSSKANYRKSKIGRAASHDRRIESLKRDIEKKDFTADVADYNKNTRYKRYGVTFNIYRTKNRKKYVTFSIIMKERYFFGIRYNNDPATGPALAAALTGVDPSIDVCQSDDPNWGACATASPRNELNFKTMKSEGFGKLKNPTARAAFMGGIANEIDTLIKKMVKSFNDKAL